MTRRLMMAIMLWGATAGAAPALGDRVGEVTFATSCAPAVQDDLERGVALLHSFFYDEARRVFRDVAGRDAGCAMAQWGVAMTLWHPLWAPPTDEEFREGHAAIAAARAAAAASATPRERAFIAALEAFYEAKDDPRAAAPGIGCHGPRGDHRGRAQAYTRAMQRVHAAFPDVESAAFYALALLGSAAPDDRELVDARRAAALLEPWWGRKPRHPGLAHYLIHAYDHPALAARGLRAARSYAAIAPWVPHVLHMPSHIFTRLGMWAESNRANLASAEAARAYVARVQADGVSFEELHALDYLTYGHLQMGDDAAARAIVDQVARIERTFPAVDLAAAYALGAVPARWVVERRAWDEAARLEVRAAPQWKVFPFAEAHVELARGIGRARTGDLAGATRSAARLLELRTALSDPRYGFFAEHLDLSRAAILALIEHAGGRDDEAVRMLQGAADREEALGKHPVSPGAIVPLRELLGDLLLELGRPADALRAYQESLAIQPARFAALVGAGRAAEAARQPRVAARYYRALIAVAVKDSPRAEVAHARRFLRK